MDSNKKTIFDAEHEYSERLLAESLKVYSVAAVLIAVCVGCLVYISWGV